MPRFLLARDLTCVGRFAIQQYVRVPCPLLASTLSQTLTHAHVYRMRAGGCIPVELAITMASQVLSISSRPTAVPGLQRARTQIVNNCTGVNNTALRPTHQCFPVTNYYGDLVL